MTKTCIFVRLESARYYNYGWPLRPACLSQRNWFCITFGPRTSKTGPGNHMLQQWEQHNRETTGEPLHPTLEWRTEPDDDGDQIRHHYRFVESFNTQTRRKYKCIQIRRTFNYYVLQTRRHINFYKLVETTSIYNVII